MKKEILKIINSNVPAAVLVDMLHEYHEKDIAQVLEYLTQEQLINPVSYTHLTLPTILLV